MLEYKFFTKLSFYVLLIAIFLYLLSFITYLKVIPSEIGFFLLFLVSLFLTLKSIKLGLLFLIFELLIGHDGHLFELKDVSIRLALFVSFMGIWFIKKMVKKEPIYALRTPFGLPFLIILFFICFAVWHGILQKNNYQLIFGDTVNYLFILLFLPFYEKIKDYDSKQKILELAGGAVVILFILSLFLLFMFSSRLVYIHGPEGIYWWARYLLTAKITQMDFNFFRIVTPAHLIILFLFLIYLSYLLSDNINPIQKKIVICLAGFCSFIILINFNRAYLIGLIGGLFFLKAGSSWKRWSQLVVFTILLMLIEMAAILFFCSRFQPQSISLVAERIETIFGSEEEVSILTRSQRLISIKNLLIKNLFFGHGLGTSVIFFDPLTQKSATTYHLDWGYLEIWLELSLFGLIALLYFLFLILKNSLLIIKSYSKNQTSQRLLIGLNSALITLMIATIFGPFIFHNLGMCYLAFYTALVGQKVN